MKPEYTPGPWVAHFGESDGYDCMSAGYSVEHGTAPNAHRIALLDVADYVPQTEREYETLHSTCARAEADARLIAAAPDLLAALDDIVRYVSPGDDAPFNAMIEEARAAIAKAKGVL